MPALHRTAARAPRLRAHAQGLARIQPARRAARDIGHRAAALHPAGSGAGPRRRAVLRPEPQGAPLSAAQGARVTVRDLLLEIGTEELPPKSLPLLSQALEAEMLAQFAQAGLSHGATTRYAAPRR